MEIPVEFSQKTFTALLGLSGCVGLLALASPRAFAAVASYGNRTIYYGVQARFDKRPVDIDSFVLDHGRLFGLIVVATVAYLWLISSYGPESYSNSFLLIIVAVAMSMGIMALFQIRRQSLDIESHRTEAHTDGLTGLANRRAFDSELSRRLSQRQRQGTPLCLMIIDIDNFKSFNDKFGHLLGDAILKDVAKVLMATARHMDIVARFGGDELAVLIPGSNLEAACQAAERLRSEISDSPFRYESHEHMLTVSIGLAEAQLDDDKSSLVKRSDSALYAAKDAGKNCCFCDGGPEPAVPAPCG
jgi:diguanylate cyclase (GGDEF)-like protein